MVEKRDFTDRFLRSIKPAEAGKRVILWDAQVPGFGLRVSDKSSADNKGAFVLVTRFPGSANPAMRRIGDYPATSLADARRIAREWREDIRKGVDPKTKKAELQREEARRRADTFAAVFEDYAAERLDRLRTGGEAKRTIQKHAMPAWGSRPISDIHRTDVKALIRDLHKTAPFASNRLLVLLKTFFSWAAEEELIEASPAAAVRPLAKENERTHVLTDTEIRALWRAAAGISYPVGPFVHLSF
jgi:hypothetical protein